MVSIVSLFDEYTNDVLDLREGSCLPRYYLWVVKFTEGLVETNPNYGQIELTNFFLTARPAYRKSQIVENKEGIGNNKDRNEQNTRKENDNAAKATNRKRSTTKNSIQELKPIQVIF